MAQEMLANADLDDFDDYGYQDQGKDDSEEEASRYLDQMIDLYKNNSLGASPDKKDKSSNGFGGSNRRPPPAVM